MIKTVLLDLDDTLFDFHRAEATAIADTFKEMGIESTEEIIRLYSGINQSQWERLERGEIDRDEVRVGRFEILFEKLGRDVDAFKTQQKYEYNLGCYHFYIDGAVDLLEAIYQKYDLYIISNGTDSVQKRRIAASGIKKYFKEIFISENVGYNKPAVEFFDRCFAKIPNFDKAFAIIIGDSPSSDILGGKNVGVRTCRFNPKGKPNPENITPDYEVSSLADIIPLLESL